MSYISAFHDKKKEVIHVVERDQEGNRVYKDYVPDYSFYVSDDNGSYKTIFQNRVKKIIPKNSADFHKYLNMYKGKKTLWESDLNLVYKCLAENYRNAPLPPLHIAFLDIEADFSQERGFAPIEDPFNQITAITVYLSWLDELITLAIPPKTLSKDEANKIASEFENTLLFDNDADLLNAFVILIEDADVLTNWNGDAYDIPYIINRTKRVLSTNDTRKMCLWDQLPAEKTAVSFNNEYLTYELVGRVQLDLLKLYQKFTYEERRSYSLDSIGEYELDEHKTSYEGNLDQLYNNDFKLFIQYNRQDVMLIKKLEDKLKLISLANALAHENTVLLPNALGTVAMIDQAIINRAHDLVLVVPNKKHSKEEVIAAGAYVADPIVGIHSYVGSTDINSLYPSDIRALNMSIDTLIGTIVPIYTKKMLEEKSSQGKSSAECWEKVFGSLEYQGIMKQDENMELDIQWEHSDQVTHCTANDAYNLIFNSGNNWILSGNGIIFTKEKKGIIPELLADWYNERKKMQKEMRSLDAINHGIEIPNDLFENIEKLL
jgi:DNA polymerase elongation subunit (family B)